MTEQGNLSEHISVQGYRRLLSLDFDMRSLAIMVGANMIGANSVGLSNWYFFSKWSRTVDVHVRSSGCSRQVYGSTYLR